MKAFILSLVVGGLLAWGGSMLMDNMFETPADQAHRSPSTRVGEGGSVAARNFDGRG